LLEKYAPQKKEGHMGLLFCDFGKKETADYRLEY